MNREYIKKISVLCMMIFFAMMMYGGRSYAMELNEEQKRDEKLSHQRAMEYEMNMIIEMLDIKRWIWPSMAMDEIDIPKDAPLGQYSPELLAQYINANENMEVEVDYYYGGFRPDICYETVQIYKINKDGKQYRIGYVIWGYNGYDVEDNDFERRDETGWKEGDGLEKKEPLSCGNKAAMLATLVQRVTYKEKPQLCPDNLEEVMETFLTIGSEKELLRLGKLPLTGRFLNQCIDSFTYLENIKYMSQFRVRFWGIGEDGKLICQCIVAPGTERILIAGSPSQEHSVYLIEMQLEDGQIDDMEITLMGAYGREG